MPTWIPKGRNHLCRCGRKALWYFHGKGYLCRVCWTVEALQMLSDAERVVDAACHPSQWRNSVSVAPRWDLGACPRCHGAVVTHLGPEPDLLERDCVNCGFLEVQSVAV